MSRRQTLWAIFFILTTQILFSQKAYAADSDEFWKFVSDHATAISVTATLAMIALLAAFVFVVGAEKSLERSTYYYTRH